MTFAQSIMYLVISAAVAIAAEYLRRRLGVERLKQIQKELILKQDLAVVAVKYAEQAWRNLDGESKYEGASEWLAEALEARGIHAEPEDIRALIEWALREIKDQLGEEWAKVSEA
ncbi:phage holin, LLH family [Desulfoscipio geothermicus]|nr:phage holin, LLH family [Desulfoscipio geothermicus]